MTTTVSELRERAAQVLAAVETLYDVHATSFECESHYPVLPGPFSVVTDIGLRGELDDDGGICVHSQYQLRASTAEDSETAWTVSFELVGTWNRSTSEKFDAIDLNSFAIGYGVTTLHPYARETAQSMVGRLGYPPFTMDMIQSPLVAPEEDEIDLDTFITARSGIEDSADH